MLRYQLVTLVLFLYLVSLGDAVREDEAFVVGLLPRPIYEKANVTWPIPPPAFNDLQNLKVIIKNFGYTADDVGFHTYLPDYAEMKSFTMHTDEVAYKARKTDHKEAREVLHQAKTGDHVAAMHSPKRLDNFNLDVQTAKNTVHIKSNKEITFNVEYKETLQDMIDSGVKVQNRAQVVFDLFGSTVQDLVGEIFSPNYPYPYPNSADIAWLVRVPDDKVVQLYIVDIDIEECCDRLTIYDGNSFHGPVIAILSGTLANQNNLTMYQSTGSSMSLHLTTDCSESKNGFRAITSVGVISSTTETPPVVTTNFPEVNTTDSVGNETCGYEYLYPQIGNYYYLSSPNYPDQYYNNIDCWWYIYSNSYNELITLQVIDFELESGYDFVYLYDLYYYVPIATLTGSNFTNNFFVAKWGMSIHLVTDSIVTKRGFNFAYQVVMNSTSETTPIVIANTTDSVGNGTCDYEYLYPETGNYYYLSSPNYPGQYYNNINCWWYIYAYSPDQLITLQIVDLDLEYNWDYVSLHNQSGVITTLTGSTFSNDSIVAIGYMGVNFVTDASVTTRGFNFMYRVDSVSNETCDYEYLYPQMSNYYYLSSPNYPGLYYNNIDCWWYIYAYSYQQVISLQVLDLDLENNFDYVSIYNGSSIPITLSGTNRPNELIISTGYMSINFVTDGSVTRNGFNFMYQVLLPPSCNETENLNAYSYYNNLTSINYPNGYLNDLCVTWSIHSVYYGYVVEVYVSDIDIEDCCDYLIFFDGPSINYPQISYQSQAGSYINSTSSDMFIVFLTDHSVTYRGFLLSYRSVYL